MCDLFSHSITSIIITNNWLFLQSPTALRLICFFYYMHSLCIISGTPIISRIRAERKLLWDIFMQKIISTKVPIKMIYFLFKNLLPIQFLFFTTSSVMTFFNLFIKNCSNLFYLLKYDDVPIININCFLSYKVNIMSFLTT